MAEMFSLLLSGDPDPYKWAEKEEGKQPGWTVIISEQVYILLPDNMEYWPYWWTCAEAKDKNERKQCVPISGLALTIQRIMD